MSIKQLVELYVSHGLDALISELGKPKYLGVRILRELEAEGFTVKWHRDDRGFQDGGLIIAGP